MTRKFLFRPPDILIFLVIMAFTVSVDHAPAAEVPPYLNPHMPLDTRVRDLLSRMTLDEKIGQMAQADSGAVADPADVQKYALGAMLSGGNSKPPENNPAAWLKMVNEYQSWV